MRFMTMVIIAVSGFVAAQEPRDAGTPKGKDLADLQGTWMVVSAEEDEGVKTPELGLQFVSVVIKGTQLTYKVLDITDDYVFSVNPTKTPKQMDLTWTDDESKKTRTDLAVYELHGDTLKICFCGKDGKRPTEFAAKADGQCLLVCKRGK